MADDDASSSSEALTAVDRDSEQAAAIADWLSQRAAAPIRVERVEPGDEQVLPDREQSELDALPSRLADRHDR